MCYSLFSLRNFLLHVEALYPQKKIFSIYCLVVLVYVFHVRGFLQRDDNFWLSVHDYKLRARWKLEYEVGLIDCESPCGQTSTNHFLEKSLMLVSLGLSLRIVDSSEKSLAYPA